MTWYHCGMTKKLSTDEFQEFVVEQFEKLSDRVEIIEGGLTEIHTELGSVHVECADIRNEMRIGFREVRKDVGEIKDILEPLVKAVDRDAETLVKHGQRITRLENLAA